MTFHLEDRLAKLESLLESLREEHERRLDSYQCRIELIEESLRHLAETLTDINHYLESQGGNK